MIQSWAHAEINVDDGGPLTVKYFGDPEGGVPKEKAPSWEQLLAELGVAGWQMVSMHRYIGSTDYWFKKQLS